MRLFFLVLFLHLIFAANSSANGTNIQDDKFSWTPIQFGITSNFVLFNSNTDLYGIGTGLYSENDNINGIAINVFGSNANNDFKGFQFSGLFNFTGNSFYGIQIAGFNSVHNESYGLQLGLINKSLKNHGIQLGYSNFGDFTGLQVAFATNNTFVPIPYIYTPIEYRHSKGKGVQMSFILNHASSYSGMQIGGNNESGKLYGVQIGLLTNISDSASGLQIGAINWADDMKGMQIGLINITDNLRGLQIGLVNIIKNNKRYLPIINAAF